MSFNHIDDLFTGGTAASSIGARMLEIIQDWSRAAGGKPYPITDLNELASLFAELDPPAAGMPVARLMDELERDLLPHTPKLNHPLYAGHMTQALPWFSPLIEALAAALNQNQVKIETAYASTLVEKQTLAWLHRLAYQAPPESYAAQLAPGGTPLGNVVSGGTIGNLTALAVALEAALPGAREHGLVAALRTHGYEGAAVLGSARMHYSLRKAVATLGLGSKALHVIPVDHDNRIRMDIARARLAELRAANVKVITIVGVAGATETGTIDPLPQLAELAVEEACWFHVDAAWGGALLLSPTQRGLLAGIDQADSIVLDGHKLFHVPLAQGAVLFKSSDGPERLRHHANYILRARSGDLGQTSLEGSRRFDALKLWATIKLLGTDGYEALFGHLRVLSRHFRELVDTHPDFEAITSSDTFIHTYRYVPSRWRAQLQDDFAAGRTDAVACVQRTLNELNAELQERLKRSGNGFVSRTVLESTIYPGDTVVLRAVLTNIYTTPIHLAELLRLQSDIGSALIASGQFSFVEADRTAMASDTS